ncbi:titin homolog [Venturia canescens]|uniref:titin homolog n=1 Tax=Venturia canescens TaxID=32260 RepID=UPI001C9CC740|nr:titin homolog [Venturia canescens]
MNTQQIRDALRYLPIATTGVFPADEIPRTWTRPAGIIVNTDEHSKPGEHWVAMYVDRNGSGWYFDSYGLPPIIPQHLERLRRNCKFFRFNVKQLQSDSSDVCGQFCFIFLHLMSCGFGMDKFNNLFSDNPRKNDEIVRQYYKAFASRRINNSVRKNDMMSGGGGSFTDRRFACTQRSYTIAPDLRDQNIFDRHMSGLAQDLLAQTSGPSSQPSLPQLTGHDESVQPMNKAQTSNVKNSGIDENIEQRADEDRNILDMDPMSNVQSNREVGDDEVEDPNNSNESREEKLMDVDSEGSVPDEVLPPEVLPPEVVPAEVVPDEGANIIDNLEDPVQQAGQAYLLLLSSDSASSGEDEMIMEIPNYTAELSLGLKEEVKMLFWRNFSDFSVSLIKNEEYASWLDKKLRRWSRHAFRLTEEGLAVGELCLVSKNGIHRRGQVVSRDEGGFSLHLVDMGVIKKYRRNTLKKRSDELRACPPLAFRCETSIDEKYRNANLLRNVGYLTETNKKFVIETIEHLPNNRAQVRNVGYLTETNKKFVIETIEHLPNNRAKVRLFLYETFEDAVEEMLEMDNRKYLESVDLFDEFGLVTPKKMGDSRRRLLEKEDAATAAQKADAKFRLESEILKNIEVGGKTHAGNEVTCPDCSRFSKGPAQHVISVLQDLIDSLKKTELDDAGDASPDFKNKENSDVKVPLLPGSTVYVNARHLELVRRIIKAHIPVMKLQNMTRTGKGGTEKIPADLLEDTKVYVNKHVPKTLKLSQKDFDACITTMINTMKQNKRKEEKIPQKSRPITEQNAPPALFEETSIEPVSIISELENILSTRLDRERATNRESDVIQEEVVDMREKENYRERNYSEERDEETTNGIVETIISVDENRKGNKDYRKYTSIIKCFERDLRSETAVSENEDMRKEQDSKGNQENIRSRDCSLEREEPDLRKKENRREKNRKENRNDSEETDFRSETASSSGKACRSKPDSKESQNSRSKDFSSERERTDSQKKENRREQDSKENLKHSDRRDLSSQRERADSRKKENWGEQNRREDRDATKERNFRSERAGSRKKENRREQDSKENLKHSDRRDFSLQRERADSRQKENRREQNRKEDRDATKERNFRSERAGSRKMENRKEQNRKEDRDATKERNFRSETTDSRKKENKREQDSKENLKNSDRRDFSSQRSSLKRKEQGRAENENTKERTRRREDERTKDEQREDERRSNETTRGQEDEERRRPDKRTRNEERRRPDERTRNKNENRRTRAQKTGERKDGRTRNEMSRGRKDEERDDGRTSNDRDEERTRNEDGTEGGWEDEKRERGDGMTRAQRTGEGEDGRTGADWEDEERDDERMRNEEEESRDNDTRERERPDDRAKRNERKHEGTV